MSRATVLALVFECRDWRIIAGDPRRHVVRPALNSVPFVSLRVGYEKFVGHGDRSTYHNTEEQASDLEPDRMQRSVKFSKDLMIGETRFDGFQTVASQILSHWRNQKNVRL